MSLRVGFPAHWYLSPFELEQLCLPATLVQLLPHGFSGQMRVRLWEVLKVRVRANPRDCPAGTRGLRVMLRSYFTTMNFGILYIVFYDWGMLFSALLSFILLLPRNFFLCCCVYL